MTMQMHLKPLRPALLAGEDNSVFVLAQIQAPASDHDRTSTPLNLGICLDRSGSMRGRPLMEAIKCATMIIDRLRSEDQVSIACFDHESMLVAEAQSASNKEMLKDSCRVIEARGSTNLFAGWRTSALDLRSITRENAMSRVLLLSDGQANSGRTDVGDITSRVSTMASLGVTTSTYGLGHRFDEHLMVAIAEAGNGQAYFGQTADDLLDPFEQEFELLLALYARSLVFNADVPEGIGLEMVNRYSGNRHRGWMLPDLASESEAWAVIELTVPANLSGSGQGELIQILDQAEIEYRDQNGLSCSIQTEALSLPSLDADGFNTTPESEETVARIQELTASRLYYEASQFARVGNWYSVDEILLVAEQQATSNPWLASIMVKMKELANQRNRDLFAKESRYASERMDKRLTMHNESIEFLNDESEKAMFLRKKSMQGKKL